MFWTIAPTDSLQFLQRSSLYKFLILNGVVLPHQQTAAGIWASDYWLVGMLLCGVEANIDIGGHSREASA